jgi:hypothetical protein
MSTLATLAAELKSWHADIDPLACLPLVQRAYQDVRNAREWSFLKKTSAWFSPSPIIIGTCIVKQFLDIVVADATAAPLWLAVALPAAPQSPLTLRQFRVAGGPIYNIIGFDGVDTITLDRPYLGPDDNAASYMIYQPYVPAPSVDFKRWLSWVDPNNNYRIRYRNLFHTQKEVDRRDPSRQSFSIPIWVVDHDYVLMPGDTQMRPRYELWPHPVQEIGYVIEYMTKGDAVLATDVLPPQVTDQCIMARARWYAHQFVANQPSTDLKIKQFHMQVQRQVEAEYRDLLNTAKNLDNQLFDSRVLEEESGSVLSGILDGGYMQSHEMFWIA